MKHRHAIAVKHWLAGSIATILALGSLSGCQPTFLAKDVFDGAQAGLPARLEENSCPITEPITAKTPAPPTVNHPDRPPQYLSLQEAIAIALENGTVTGRGVSGLGLIPAPGSGAPTTTQIGFSPSSQVDSVRVLALNPAVSGANIELAASRFDAIFANSMIWTGIDGLLGVPNLGNIFQNNSILGGLGNTGGQSARYESSIIKAFAGGGVANLSFLVDYRNLNSNASNPVTNNGLLNPQYTVRPSFGFEQPLWRDFGVAINQILPIFPTPSGLTLVSQNDSIAFNSHQGKTGQEGILIARLRFDQSRAHFENNMNALVVNVEIAYWNLYNKYGQLYSFETNLKILHKAWQETYHQFKLGRKNPDEYEQFLGQYEEFRGERMRALSEVLEAERNLRSILGLPVEDGARLVPITPPTMAGLKPRWENCIDEGLTSRPDLAWARQELEKNQHALTVAKNNLNPDLRLFARFEPFGDGSTLTGNGTFTDNSGPFGGPGVPKPTNAFRSLMNGHLADYQVGLSLNMPLGFRAEHAAVRIARLELTKSYLLLRDWENLVAFQVAREYQEVEHWYNRILIHRAERVAYQESLTNKDKIVALGKSQISDPALQYLEVQRRYAAALVKEYIAIAEYNSTLARLEWAKGTILRYDNVYIGEGALPQCAQVRAVEYEKERTKSIVLRERPDSLSHPGRLCGTKDTEPTNLSVSSGEEKEGAAAPAKEIIESPRYKKSPLLRITTPGWDEKRTLPGEEEKIELKRKSLPTQQLIPIPSSLPPLEGTPMPSALPPSTGAIPTVTPPSAGVKQIGTGEFVLLEDARTPTIGAGYEAPTPLSSQTIGPTIIQAGIGDPLGGAIAPAARQ